jgi:enoyl-CoA hydratase/carnithine racemase
LKMLKMLAIEHTHTVKSRWLFTEAQYIKPQTESEDFKEGIRAFKEKRKPVYRGK